jgi:hypothetical protein
MNMNDTISTAVCVTRTDDPVYPTWFNTFRSKIAGMDDRALRDFTIQYFGLLDPLRLPTPGQAGTFGQREWADLAQEFGLEPDTEQTHSFIWRHKRIKGLILSCPKTSGDWRSPMRVACDFRRDVRAVLDTALDFITNVRSNKPVPVELVASEAALRELMLTAWQKRTAEGRSNDMKFTGETNHDMGQIRSLLNKIGSITGEQPARIFVRTGRPEQGPRLLLLAEDSPSPVGLYDDLVDLLNMARSEQEAVEREKQEKRDARDAEIAARQAAKDVDKKDAKVPRSQAQSVFDERRRLIQEVISKALDDIDSAGARLRNLRGNLPMFTIPDLNDVGDAKRVAELEAQLAAEQAKNASLESRVQLVESLSATNAAMMGEVRAQVDDRDGRVALLQDNLNAMADLVIDTIDSTGSLNPFQMVKAFGALKDEALKVKSPAPLTLLNAMTATAEPA